MPSLIDERTQFTDTDGLPIVNGKIYIGSQNNNPVANLITIYSDRDLTVPLANPQSTDAYGKSVNKIWIPGKYSIQVNNSADVQKYQDLDAGDITQTGISVLSNVQGTNTITAEGSPAISTLVDQQQYNFTTAGANTGAVTLQIDLNPAYSIKKQHDVDLVSGDFEANQIASVVWNATDTVFELVSNVIGSFSVLIDEVSLSGTSTEISAAIPSWAKKLTVMFYDVSWDATAFLSLEIGDSGGYETSGYTSDVGGGASSQSSFILSGSQVGSVVFHGALTLTLQDSSSNRWMLSGTTASTGQGWAVSGWKALTATLDRIQITTSAGTASSDGGAVSVMYE